MTGTRDPRCPDEAPSLLRVGRSYRAPLLVRQFPPELPFGFLGRVLPTTEPVEFTVELHPIPSSRALELLHSARAVAETELVTGGNGGHTSELEVERETAEQFGRAVARRTQELWKIGIRFVSLASSRPRAESVRTRLAERLSAVGFRTQIPRYEVPSALAAPGLRGVESRPAGYWHTLPTDGVAALFPFADESIVEPGGILVGLALADASPVFLNRWEHTSYSWGLFGTTGAGKSFAAALSVLRTRWLRPEVEVTILDPLGEFSAFVRALGGSVIRLAGGEVGRLNPLDPITTGGDRREKAGRVGTMLRALFPSLEDAESAALDTAITRLYERGPEVPTLDDLISEVRRTSPETGRLGALLEVFHSGSLRGANGPTTVADGPGLTSVDFRGLADDHLPFHLTYVLDWAYGRLRDRPGPKLLVVDEAHLLTRHAATAQFLDRVVRHVRHFEGGVLLVTQTPDDFLGRPEGRAILGNLYATAFLRLPGVSQEARTFFGLTPSEAEWLPKARLPRQAGYSESLWRIGELHLPLAVIAASPEFEFLTSTLGRRPDVSGDASPAGVL